MRAFIERLAHAEPGFDVNHAAQGSDTDKAFFVPPTKVSFGPFRLLPKDRPRLRRGGGRRRARFDPDSLHAGPGLRVARRERSKR
jgi:hypothetical protein